MKVGLYLPVGNGPASEDQVELAVSCEERGFDSLWVRDIPMKDDRRAVDVDQEFEGLVYLAYLAARTRRIALGTAVVSLPLRHPVLLAKQAATLDRLSGGRFRLGVGTGYRKDLYDVFGVDFDSRHERMRDSLKLLRQLWSGEEVTVRTTFGVIDGQEMLPRCVRPNGPEVLLASSSLPSPEFVPLVDGWMTHRRKLSQMRQDFAQVRATGPMRRAVLDVAVALGEKPGVEVEVPGLGNVLNVTPDQLVAVLRAVEDQGADEVILAFAGRVPRWEQVQLVAEQVLPALSSAPTSGAA